MALNLDVALVEMTPPFLHWQTQNLSLIYRGKIGGKQDSTYGGDVGFRGRGLPYWEGSMEVAPGDRGSLLDTSRTESLLAKIQRPNAIFACPILRGTENLWTFRATSAMAAGEVDLDPTACADNLTISIDAVEQPNTYQVTPTVNLATPNADLTNIKFNVTQGAYISVGGFLYMITSSSDFDTATIDIEPKKGILELVANATMQWRLPYLAARIPQGFNVEMPRFGPFAGPWNFNFEEAN